VVLIDWQMPDMDGIETTWHISHDLGLQHQPTVVMVTAYGADEARKAGGGAGASAFLDKPVSQSRLWDTLIGIITPQLTKPRLLPNQSESQAALTGVRVLLVEDNDINQQIARELLESMGVAVTLADNGQQALDLLLGAPEPLPWSMVLMDLQMPVMDGHQATLLLRQQARFASLPIIALTAHASAEEGARCLREGMNAHLTKPIEPAALHRAISYWSAAAATGADLRISGIDVDKGLLQCGGSRKLYESLLQRFVASLVNTPREIRQALGAGDIPVAERSAHTLKGVAANLGAGTCSRLSSELEKSIRQHEPSAAIQAQLTTLEQHLTELTLAIGRALPVAAPAQPALMDPVDREQLQRICCQLAELLRSSNAQARLLLQEHAALLQSGLGANFASFGRRVQDFEFSQALTELYDAASAVQLDLR
jgi:CheY-like chemotaxis protein